MAMDVGHALVGDLRNIFKVYFAKTGIAAPEGWVRWRSMMTLYNIREIRQFYQRTAIISHIGDRLIRTPFDLAALRYSEISPYG